MCLLRQPRDLFCSGLSFIRTLLGYIVAMLLHLSLMLMKIELIYPGCSNFEGFDVSRLTFHKASITVRQSYVCWY